MTFLVADVGGTNTRLALVEKGDPDPIASLKVSNAEFGSFYEVVNGFLAQHPDNHITASCVAMAGPVFAGRGKLTNLDWEISTDDLKKAARSNVAVVMNDLSALGYAVAQLRQNDLTTILDRDAGNGRNGQSLVVGIGTGFNVCPVKINQAGSVICLEAEGGHIQLPKAVCDLLEAEIGTLASHFEAAEELFSGRGLALFHRLRNPKDNGLSGGDIVRAHMLGSDSEASASLKAFSGMLGAHCRELLLQYLPLDGLYFAGSVARGVFGSGLTEDFTAELDRHNRFGELLGQVPVSVINEDAAALVGCAVVAQMI